MTSFNASLQYIGYGLAGLVYLFLAILLLTNFKGRLRGGLLAGAAVVSTAWAFVLAWAAQTSGLTGSQLFFVEMGHDAVWLVFLSALLRGAIGTRRDWVLRYGGIAMVGGILAVGIGSEMYANYDLQAEGAESVLVLGSVLTALFALVAIEQIYRNTRKSQRKGIKYLCIGLGGIFAYDLFMYSNAMVTGQINDVFWGVRGYVVAMCLPLIAVAAQRSPSWSVDIFVSRHVVFHTATLIGAGFYLSVIGFSGYYVRAFGGEWGAAAQIVFFSAAVIALFVYLFSDPSRARLRVFISKHFYKNKYDYREEWLRLIGTLTTDDESMPLKRRSIKALAEILDVPAGVLWIGSGDSDSLKCVSAWNLKPSVSVLRLDGSLVRFLAKTGWVIDLREYDIDSSRYENLSMDADDLGVSDPAFIVPLIHNSELLGIIVLTKSTTTVQLNFEDRDLLKTAGQQVASYLAQEMAAEQLAEGRQFEAFNRLTAYLMHDLKNVIAQQSLVVENAQKHKGNPAFIDDAMATIKGSVARMRRVMDHLQHRSLDQPRERIEIGSLITQAVLQCADRQPAPRTILNKNRVWVRADKERLLMALYHAIRNAQDATDKDGSVVVSMDTSETGCDVHIVDTGVGMSEEFIRDRLFRPFDSTKGTQGMGMGAYQLRETTRSMGGDVRVQSQPGRGTTIVLELRRVQ